MSDQSATERQRLRQIAKDARAGQQAERRATAEGLRAIEEEAERLAKTPNQETRAAHYIEALKIFANAYKETAGEYPASQTLTAGRRDKWRALLKAIRQAKGLTQTEAGALFGVTFATINRIEAGYHEPAPKLAKAILDEAARLKIKTDLKAGDYGTSRKAWASDPGEKRR